MCIRCRYSDYRFDHNRGVIAEKICKTQSAETNLLHKEMVTAALSKNFTRHWTKKCINVRNVALELVLRGNVASGTG